MAPNYIPQQPQLPPQMPNQPQLTQQPQYTIPGIQQQPQLHQTQPIQHPPVKIFFYCKLKIPYHCRLNK